MIQEDNARIHFFNSGKVDLFITEFGHSYRKSPRDVGPWVRDVYLLHLVLRKHCDFCDFKVEAGDAFLISKGNVHSFHVDEGYEHYWIGFDGTKVQSLAALFDLDIHSHRLLSLLKTPLDLAKEYENVFQQCGPESENAVIGLLMSTLALVDNSDRTQGCSYVDRAKNFMDRNYYRKITMDEVAAHVNLSEKYLCRLFKDELGLTPIRYLITIRMEQAKKLLRETDMRIRDIAATVGYPSQLVFSTAFSSFESCSPTEYREYMKKTHPQ